MMLRLRLHFLVLSLVVSKSLTAQSIDPPTAGYTIMEVNAFDDCHTPLSYDSIVVSIDTVISDSIYWQLNFFDQETGELIDHNSLLSPLQDSGAIYAVSDLGTIDGLAFCMHQQCSGTISITNDSLSFFDDLSIDHPCLDDTRRRGSWVFRGPFRYLFDQDNVMTAIIDFQDSHIWRLVERSTNTAEVPRGVLKIFPNPSENEIFVQLGHSGMAGHYQIFVFSVLGQAVVQESHSSIYGQVRLDVSDLEPGTYVMCLMNGTEILTTRFVKL